MTRHYIKKTCPYCKKVVSRETYIGAERELYGTPFRTCQHCHCTFVDREIKERACEPYKEPSLSLKSYILRNWLGWLFSLLLLIALLVAMVQGIWGMLALVLPCILILLFPTWHAYKNRYRERDQYIAEWYASDQRLSNPEYAFKLYQARYSVPQKYLSTIKDRVDEYNKALAEETKEYEWAKKVVYEFGKSHPAVSEIAKIKGISKSDVICYYESIIREYNNKHLG